MVGLVIVSHSPKIAAGVEDLVRQLAQGSVPLATAGGALDGSLGTDAGAVLQAVERVDRGDGVVVLMDLGSAVLSAEAALDLLPEDIRARVSLCDAPLVEGAVAAAVEASLGSTLVEVKRAAEGARSMAKL